MSMYHTLEWFQWKQLKDGTSGSYIEIDIIPVWKSLDGHEEGNHIGSR